MLDIREACPKGVEAMALRHAEAKSSERWVAASPCRASLGHGTLLEPVQRWFKKKKVGPGVAAAAQAVAGGIAAASASVSPGEPGADDAPMPDAGDEADEG